jgi:hypothetical protein
MLLEGSCHCRAVRFRVEAPEPYPFMYCYCSICRKTAGGGYAINLRALSDTLVVEGEENLRIYNAKLYNRGDEVTVSEAERTFSEADRMLSELAGSGHLSVESAGGTLRYSLPGGRSAELGGHRPQT